MSSLLICKALIIEHISFYGILAWKRYLPTIQMQEENTLAAVRGKPRAKIKRRKT